LFSVLDIHTRRLDIEVGFGAGLTSASDHRVFKLILMKDLLMLRRVRMTGSNSY
jgi:hypothetical protein